MTTSTLVKVGVLALAALAAKGAYSAMNSRSTGKGRQQRPSLPAVGKPADAFSNNAIQHDLSSNDPI